MEKSRLKSQQSHSLKTTMEQALKEVFYVHRNIVRELHHEAERLRASCDFEHSTNIQLLVKVEQLQKDINTLKTENQKLRKSITNTKTHSESSSDDLQCNDDRSEKTKLSLSRRQLKRCRYIENIRSGLVGEPYPLPYISKYNTQPKGSGSINSEHESPELKKRCVRQKDVIGQDDQPIDGNSSSDIHTKPGHFKHCNTNIKSQSLCKESYRKKSKNMESNNSVDFKDTEVCEKNKTCDFVISDKTELCEKRKFCDSVTSDKMKVCGKRKTHDSVISDKTEREKRKTCDSVTSNKIENEKTRQHKNNDNRIFGNFDTVRDCDSDTDCVPETEFVIVPETLGMGETSDEDEVYQDTVKDVCDDQRMTNVLVSQRSNSDTGHSAGQRETISSRNLDVSVDEVDTEFNDSDPGLSVFVQDKTEMARKERNVDRKNGETGKHGLGGSGVPTKDSSKRCDSTFELPGKCHISKINTGGEKNRARSSNADSETTVSPKINKSFFQARKKNKSAVTNEENRDTGRQFKSVSDLKTNVTSDKKKESPEKSVGAKKTNNKEQRKGKQLLEDCPSPSILDRITCRQSLGKSPTIFDDDCVEISDAHMQNFASSDPASPLLVQLSRDRNKSDREKSSKSNLASSVIADTKQADSSRTNQNANTKKNEKQRQNTNCEDSLTNPPKIKNDKLRRDLKNKDLDLISGPTMTSNRQMRQSTLSQAFNLKPAAEQCVLSPSKSNEDADIEKAIQLSLLENRNAKLFSGKGFDSDAFDVLKNVQPLFKIPESPIKCRLGNKSEFVQKPGHKLVVSPNRVEKSISTKNLCSPSKNEVCVDTRKLHSPTGAKNCAIIEKVHCPSINEKNSTENVHNLSNASKNGMITKTIRSPECAKNCAITKTVHSPKCPKNCMIIEKLYSPSQNTKNYAIVHNPSKGDLAAGHVEDFDETLPPDNVFTPRCSQLARPLRPVSQPLNGSLDPDCTLSELCVESGSQPRKDNSVQLDSKMTGNINSDRKILQNKKFRNCEVKDKSSEDDEVFEKYPNNDEMRNEQLVCVDGKKPKGKNERLADADELKKTGKNERQMNAKGKKENEIEIEEDEIKRKEQNEDNTDKMNRKWKNEGKTNIDMSVLHEDRQTDRNMDLTLDHAIHQTTVTEESQQIPSSSTSFKFGSAKRLQINRSASTEHDQSQCLSEKSDSDSDVEVTQVTSGQCGPVNSRSFNDSFDRVPKRKEADFAYVDVVRGKQERKKLQATTCQECYEYYKSTGMSDEEIKTRVKECSRHRARYIAPSTPEHFWSIGFPDTPECRERGYIRDETPSRAKPSAYRRRRKLEKRFKSKNEENTHDENESDVE